MASETAPRTALPTVDDGPGMSRSSWSSRAVAGGGVVVQARSDDRRAAPETTAVGHRRSARSTEVRALLTCSQAPHRRHPSEQPTPVAPADPAPFADRTAFPDRTACADPESPTDQPEETRP